ncbi:MAG: helix-turn-helix domain-containing protein [Pseudooceanicola sp.]|nr:helix-turn-helix domain-containing protein [Pseudooceanicola sp.]
MTGSFPPRLMPAPEAARYLGVSESTLRNLDLPRKKLGAKRVYDKGDLDAYADSLPYESEPQPTW